MCGSIRDRAGGITWRSRRTHLGRWLRAADQPVDGGGGRVGGLSGRAHGHAPVSGPAPQPSLTDPRHVTSVVGLVLLVVGVWLPIDSGGPSFWNNSHTLGILLLLLAALNLLSVRRATWDVGLLSAST